MPPAGRLTLASLSLGSLGAGCVDLTDRVPLIEGSGNFCAADRAATVQSVLDGDTLCVDGCVGDVDKIRMLGVDAPEVAHNSTETAEPCGNTAYAFQEEVLIAREVTLQFDVECTDLYDRTLGWVLLEGDSDDALAGLLADLDGFGLDEDGSFSVLANALVVRMGYATVFEGDIAKNIRYAELMDSAEQAAAAEERGLWSPEECSGE
jgi:micrococcal nuclease